MGSDNVQLALGFQQRRLHCHDVRRLRTYRMQPVQCRLCSGACAQPFYVCGSEEPRRCGLVDSYHSRLRQLRTVPQLCSLSGSERGTDVCVRARTCVCVVLFVGRAGVHKARRPRSARAGTVPSPEANKQVKLKSKINEPVKERSVKCKEAQTQAHTQEHADAQ
jgi:hypothetical protein